MCWLVMLTTLSSTLLCIRIAHPRDRASVARTVAATLNDDLAVISDWCSGWTRGVAMLVNPSKTRGMLISRSRTVEPLFPDLFVDGTVVEMVSELKILGVILDSIHSKLAFEKQVRAIAASASSASRSLGGLVF